MMFLKKLLLIKPVHQKSVIFVTIGFFDKEFKLQMNVCNGCHDLLMMPITLDDIAILNIRGVDYRCNVYGISKSNAANLLQNAGLTKKKQY